MEEIGVSGEERAEAQKDVEHAAGVARQELVEPVRTLDNPEAIALLPDLLPEAARVRHRHQGDGVAPAGKLPPEVQRPVIRADAGAVGVEQQGLHSGLNRASAAHTALCAAPSACLGARALRPHIYPPPP